MKNKTQKRKARILKYWQVVDENNCTIDNAYSYQEAIRIKKEYENEK